MRSFLVRALSALAVAGCLTVATAAPAAAKSSTGFAYQVTVDRSGGFAGLHDHYAVNWPAHGADGRWVLILTTTKQYKGLAASYLPANQCCDRFAYLVTVRYTDGVTKKVQTLDGAKAPALLWRVIHLTEKAGTHS